MKVKFIYPALIALPLCVFASHDDNDHQHDTDRQHGCDHGHQQNNRDRERGHGGERGHMTFDQQQNVYEHNLYERNQEQIKEEEKARVYHQYCEVDEE